MHRTLHHPIDVARGDFTPPLVRDFTPRLVRDFTPPYLGPRRLTEGSVSSWPGVGGPRDILRSASRGAYFTDRSLAVCTNLGLLA